MLRFCSFASLFIVLLFSSPAWATNEQILPEITPENFDTVYKNTTVHYEKLAGEIPDWLKKKFRDDRGMHHKRFLAEEAQLKKEYEFYLESKRKLDPVFKLKEDLNDLYLKFYRVPPDERDALNHESIALAMELIGQTETLREKYKSFFIPVVHNMMLDVGIRKRGACKHWAEDLLNHLHTVNRNFFSITWGESHPGKFTEHNVAVLIPRGRKFEDGLLFDPWRTSGTPFWIRVTEDKHFRWTQWPDYGTF